MMEQQYIDLIEYYHKEGVSVAGITSLLQNAGCKMGNYMELRKNIQKEIQRLVYKK